MTVETDNPTGAPIMVCVGTRPEAVKLAPVIHELRRRGHPVVTVSTGQHREMLDQALDAFGIEPEVELGLMRPNQTLAELTGRVVPELDRVIAAQRPGAVLVQGDTTTALSGALAAFYRHVPVGHVEAGLRTGDTENPFPEEMNRRLVGQIAQWHFCPTTLGRENLLREGVDPAAVHVTGNTVIDAALLVADRHVRRPARDDGRRRILVTVHRRESQGEVQRGIAAAVARLASRPDVHVTFPLHLSPAVRASMLPVLGSHPNVDLIEPLGYEEMIREIADSDLILTDSGGLQEEAPAFDVPVLVLRETTERPEGVDAGCSALCGTDPDWIVTAATRLLDSREDYLRMAEAVNPYGDGHASERIAQVLLGPDFRPDEVAVGRLELAPLV